MRNFSPTSPFTSRRFEPKTEPMTLESLIAAARAQGASDLHLEAGLPAAMRVRGDLQTLGEPVPPAGVVVRHLLLPWEASWEDRNRVAGQSKEADR